MPQPDDLLAREGYGPREVPALLAWARARANVLLQGLDPDSTLGELLGGPSGHVSRDSAPVRRDSDDFRTEFDELDGDIPADLRQAVTAATSSQPSAPVIDDDPDSGLGGFARFQSMLKLSRPYPYRQQEPAAEEPRPTLLRSFALAAQRESDYSSSNHSPPADLSATLPLAAALGISSEESAALVLGIPDEDASEGSGVSDLFYPSMRYDRDEPRAPTVSSHTSAHASGFIDDDDDVRMPIQDDDDDLPLPTLSDDDEPRDDDPPLDLGRGGMFEDAGPVRRAAFDDLRRRDDAPARRASLDDARGVLIDDDDAPPVRHAAPEDPRREDIRPVHRAAVEDARRPVSPPVRRSSIDDVRRVLDDDDDAPPPMRSPQAPVRRPSMEDERHALHDDDDDESPPPRSQAPVRRSSIDDVRGVLHDDDDDESPPPTRSQAPVRRSSMEDVRGALLDDDDDAPNLPPAHGFDDDDDEPVAQPARTRDTPPMPGLPAIDVDAESGAPVLRHRTPKKKVVELGAPVGKPRAGSGAAAVGPRGPSPKPPNPRKPPPPPARKPPPPPPVDDDIQELSRVELIEDLPSYLRDDDE
ncbi:hypothetical protein [Nannocystis bainbridge]|uniref:Uncharacterized protein n=1 Tax=Nannocystis bainbridge TaxID=2995303 RepID=A0ABT5E7S4_9BACT|nr:hypothetical protein [Nannocystis bainbridge]MDC0721915.1 hypothetical protein [Nannocystis bainbridge]